MRGPSESHFAILCVTVLHMRNSAPSRYFYSFFGDYLMNNRFDTTKAEPEKVIAERINGWAAMMGFWAVVGAYLTTGQIIPGFV